MSTYTVKGKGSTKRMKVEVDLDEDSHEEFSKNVLEEYTAAKMFFDEHEELDSVSVEKDGRPGSFAFRREHIENEELPISEAEEV